MIVDRCSSNESMTSGYLFIGSPTAKQWNEPSERMSGELSLVSGIWAVYPRE